MLISVGQVSDFVLLCLTNINRILLGRETDIYFGFTSMLVESFEKKRKKMHTFLLNSIKEFFAADKKYVHP